MSNDTKTQSIEVADPFEKLRDFKVTVQLYPIGNAPPLKQCKFAMAGSTPVRVLIKFLEGAVMHSGTHTGTQQPDVNKLSTSCDHWCFTRFT
ncbi:hypothetical protein Pmar_PMAR028852 [Perkinsus marinus ATCC 50983]|uniref:Uncharacterized protein n=1 Tax=Perkinsus marinus (strain ATCC 50983 / TXsc) TaxID=423536 RepID=C5K8W4_PERM5|nr:hypothetical protein Pmar_PMAR028852 [Perkinsus marinus ATCC 50983]EER19081.1 hypothetical protein Pmar_PMAR028852 [Perkinsus marinus ATCC 50983]|eukprot:XP_002787285.1 hypothetical protein Pmar_PMAR028852 [Perkinsus marinus ATCC 50983]